MATNSKSRHKKGDRFTVMHTESSKERMEYVKDALGLTTTSQMVHLAIRQYYQVVRDEQETKSGKLVV